MSAGRRPEKLGYRQSAVWLCWRLLCGRCLVEHIWCRTAWYN